MEAQSDSALEAYQLRYADNMREIALLSDDARLSSAGFDAWFAGRQEAEARIAQLRRENSALLSEHLFPALDNVFSASPETLASLEAFADRLMDWKTNLDIGVYVAIHEALLSLQRVRRDRNGTIRELYKLGMGRYYLNMYASSIDSEDVRTLMFRNEMLFTEAASYFRFFEQIDDEETRGYIIRAMANIALCSRDHRRKIAASSRALQVLRDPYYRALAPGLPWDSFVSRTHQQMSANRHELSAGDLTREDLAAVLDSCYEVHMAQRNREDPSVRWIWPLYEMEYSCGYADAETTLNRLESLISDAPDGRFDMTGLYGAVQLPLYYCHMLHNHPRLAEDPRRLDFNARCSRKMLQAFLACPPEQFDTYFFYLVKNAVAEYLELPGALSYRALTTRLMQRFAGALYIRSRKAGDMLKLLTREALDRFPDYFDDLPFLPASLPEAQKRSILLDYAEGCGLYHDFGLLSMNMSRILQSRPLFETESRMYQLHPLSGAEDLKSRPSTQRYADIALGHHAWYNASGGYPAAWKRNASPFRAMTDLVALTAFLLEEGDETPEERLRLALQDGGTRFSPRAASLLAESSLRKQLLSLITDEGKAYYAEVYRELTEASSC